MSRFPRPSNSASLSKVGMHEVWQDRSWALLLKNDISAVIIWWAKSVLPSFGATRARWQSWASFECKAQRSRKHLAVQMSRFVYVKRRWRGCKRRKRGSKRRRRGSKRPVLEPFQHKLRPQWAKVWFPWTRHYGEMRDIHVTHDLVIPQIWWSTTVVSPESTLTQSTGYGHYLVCQYCVTTCTRHKLHVTCGLAIHWYGLLKHGFLTAGTGGSLGLPPVPTLTVTTIKCWLL